MKSNIQTSEVTTQPRAFIPSFTFPLMGDMKFTPKLGFKNMDLAKAKKLFGGNVKGSTYHGRINDQGYVIVSVAVNDVEVGTLSFIQSDLDEFSSPEEVSQFTAELAEKLKSTPINHAVENGDELMAEW